MQPLAFIRIMNLVMAGAMLAGAIRSSESGEDGPHTGFAFLQLVLMVFNLLIGFSIL